MYAFIRATQGIREALEQCERSLARISDTSCEPGSSASLVSQICAQYIRVMSASVASVPTEELRSMKTGFKHKLEEVDEEFKKQSKDIFSLKQSMEKAEEAFERADSDMKKAHCRTTDAFPRKALFPWSDSSADRDKQFERMQKLAAEQGKIAAESQSLLDEFVSLHSGACARANVVSNELASMRRRMNRKIVHESNLLVSRIQTGFEGVTKSSVPTVIKQLTINNPSSGNFEMNLPDPETSLRLLLGSDKENKIKSMQARPDRIEYRAVQSYLAKESGELSFNRNEVIQVIKKDPSGWWYGRNSLGETGVFPSVLLAERPAGALLPLHQISSDTLKPNLTQLRSGGSWHTYNGSVANAREQLVMCQTPYSLVGVVQFRYIGEGIAVEPGEVVRIGGLTSMSGFVQVRKENGREGPVPLKILGIKDDNNCSKLSNDSNVMNEWSYSINW